MEGPLLAKAKSGLMVMRAKLLWVHELHAFDEIVALKECVLQVRYVGFMKTTIRNFEDLDCWKAAREVRLFVAGEVIGLFPKEEKYRLGDQILRAARSATANIAEGYGRFHYPDKAKYCGHARGSIHEVLDHLITAADEDFISESLLASGRAKIETCLRLLNGYMTYLKSAASRPVDAAPVNQQP